MDRRQAVRHWVLVPAFAGSNPAGPASLIELPIRAFFGMMEVMERLKFNTENDGAMDALERPDVQEVWEQVAPRLDEATEKALKYEQTKVIRPENVRDYGVDRTEENLEMLERTENLQLAELYKKVLEENPELCVVKLADQEMDGNAFFSGVMRDTTTGQVMPVVGYNLSNPETYRLSSRETWMPRAEEGDKRLGLKFITKELALGMGADWKRCARNRKLMTAMMFLHEMGHAKEYIDDYLTPEYLRREGAMRGERMAASVATAADMVAARRRESLKSAKRPLEPRVAEEMAYREMPDEKFADEFALEYLTRHYDEFFVEGTEAGAKEKAAEVARDWAVGEERVRTVLGQERKIDADFAYLLGVTWGSRVKIEPVREPEPEPSPYDVHEGDYGLYGYEESKRFDAEGRYVRPKHAKPERYVGRHQKVGGEGVLMATPQEGGAIYLREGERAVRVCRNASGFRYVSRRGEDGRLVTQVYFDDEEGQKYEIRRGE